MAKLTVRAKEQKRFVRLFTELCQWNSPWERWNDMVTMFAIEIANSVDTFHQDDRSRTYSEIARKYSDEEKLRFAEILAEMIEQLEKNPYQDFLGSMYMELELGNANAGQFFTPYGVCKGMAKMTVTEIANQMIEEHGYITLNDPACGGGATLIASADILHEMGINWQSKAYFVGNDLDPTVAMMCYVQMSLIGCAGYVRIGDTLRNPQSGDLLLGEGTRNTWYFPMTFVSEEWNSRIIARRMRLMARSISGKEVKENVGVAQGGQSGIQLSFLE